MTDDGTPVVLVVEDEPDVAETYQLWLADDYEVRLAEDGREALDTIDESVDVVLLDRMMPGVSGDQVLERVRDRDLDCQVAMVTAVDPDFDIIEMGFDDYVTKPPTADQLRGTVEELLERREAAEQLAEYRSLVSKRAALQTEKAEAALQESEEYAELERQIRAVEADLDESADRYLDDAAFVGSLREMAGDEGEREGS